MQPKHVQCSGFTGIYAYYILKAREMWRFSCKLLRRPIAILLKCVSASSLGRLWRRIGIDALQPSVWLNDAVVGMLAKYEWHSPSTERSSQPPRVRKEVHQRNGLLVVLRNWITDPCAP